MHGFRLIAVDCPGCGLTDPFVYTGVEYRQHGVAFLSSLLDALGIEFARLIGHSVGGLWCLRLADERPGRVSSLVLAGAPQILDMRPPLAVRLLCMPGLNRLMMALQPPSPKQARKLVPQLLGTAAAANMDPEYIDVWYRSDALPGAGDAFRTQLEQIGRPWGVRPGILFSESDSGGSRSPRCSSGARATSSAARNTAGGRAPSWRTPTSR